MSNQVYENNQIKYYQQKGIVLFQSIPDTFFMPTVSTSIIKWEQQVSQCAGIAEVGGSPDPTLIIALKEAMYTFNFTMQFSPAAGPTANDIQILTQIIFHSLTYPTELPLSQSHDRFIAIGSHVGETTWAVNISLTVFMTPGEYIYLQMSVENDVTGVNLLYSTCNITCI